MNNDKIYLVVHFYKCKSKVETNNKVLNNKEVIECILEVYNYIALFYFLNFRITIFIYLDEIKTF